MKKIIQCPDKMGHLITIGIVCVPTQVKVAIVNIIIIYLLLLMCDPKSSAVWMTL